ncbi:hypothetical protein [Chromatium okenii]|uniref:hypothetical protein n=1 Tax=Chromatium okenii TaxID=61644 RepID=UPI001F5B35B7|nr:hypothetical protein [Chromatium okenii]
MTSLLASNLPLELLERHGHAPLSCGSAPSPFIGDNTFSDAEYRNVLTELHQRPEEALAFMYTFRFVMCAVCIAPAIPQ